jgi:hypothetical protein
MRATIFAGRIPVSAPQGGSAPVQSRAALKKDSFMIL